MLAGLPVHKALGSSEWQAPAQTRAPTFGAHCPNVDVGAGVLGSVSPCLEFLLYPERPEDKDEADTTASFTQGGTL